MKKLIREQEVARAAKETKRIFIDKDTIITPSAKDLARATGVRFEIPAANSADALSLQIKDIFPVKVVAIASDHGGFEMKKELLPFLRKLGYVTHDLGPAGPESCDYPDYAFKVAELVASGKVDRGIMIDSVGLGSAMAANRIPGVLAAKCNNAFEAQSAREHNYANYLTFGAKMIGIEIAKDIVKTFLETKGGAERHQRRIQRILNYKSKL